MEEFEIYTKRLKNLEPNLDPLSYSHIPRELRIQVIHIWESSIGEYSSYQLSFTYGFWKIVHDKLSRELGKFHLHPLESKNDYSNCIEFLLNEDTDNVLNIIDLTFHMINTVCCALSEYERKDMEISQTADSAIEELNKRFREHNLGYQFENGKIIRVDSQFIHEEVIKPALTLLHNNNFDGAEEEFLKAYEHYRHGRFKESIAESLKSLESAMKIIAKRKTWEIKPNDTASKLIELMISKEVIPTYLQQQFTSLRSTLETGVVVLRNKTSGHGQGEVPTDLPDHFVSYALHLTASNIVFLVNCYLEMESRQNP